MKSHQHDRHIISVDQLKLGIRSRFNIVLVENCQHCFQKCNIHPCLDVATRGNVLKKIKFCYKVDQRDFLNNKT